MSTSNLSTRRLRRIAAASSFTAVLMLGAGTSAAEDQHSGGVSSSNQSVDPGARQTEVRGIAVSRGGLPLTGSDVAGLVALGAAAVAVGSGAVVASKRRTHLST